MPNPHRIVVASVIAIAAALLLIGIVSATPVRHLIQAAPCAAIAIATHRRKIWASYAALAVFLFWLFIMTLIWLYLLHLASVVTGNFSPSEITLTVVVGCASIVGSLAVFRAPRPANTSLAVIGFSIGACTQIAAMWLSLQSFAATS